jgi:hypothetical protein
LLPEIIYSKTGKDGTIISIFSRLINNEKKTTAMHKILLVSTILLLNSLATFSQLVKVENGISISSMNENRFGLFEQNIYSTTHAIGYEYFRHSFYYLSSKIAYVEKGGKEHLFMLDDQYKTLTENKKYLHLNTTFRIKYAEKNLEFHAGLGPQIDVLLGSAGFRNKEFNMYAYNRVSFGIIPEIEIRGNIAGRGVIGLQLSHIFSLSPVAKSEAGNLNNNTTLLSITLGYNLK